MRTFLVALVLLFALIPCAILLGILCIVKIFSPEKCYAATYRFIHAILNAVVRCAGTEVEVIGKENIPKEGPLVFIANHRSYFDIFISYALLERPAGYVAKEEIAKIPFVKKWMDNAYCLFLKRDNTRAGIKTIKEGIEKVKSGIPMWIYAEGHATMTDTMLPFKSGSFKLATGAGAPIVPVTFVGTEDIYERHRPIVKKAKVTVIFNEPVETAGLDRKEQKILPERVQNTIIENLRMIAMRDGRQPADPPVDPDLWEKRKEI